MALSTFPNWWPTEISTAQPAENLWDALRAQLDIRAYIPARAPGIVAKQIIDRSGKHHILKNPTTHSYARLSLEEYWVWEKIDGIQTVQQLVLAYFLEYKAFAFVSIISLLDRLLETNMLGTPPGRLYAGLSTAIHTQSTAHKFTWLAHTVFTKEFAIKNLDVRLARIHRAGGWILFTWPVQMLFLLISVIGLVLFVILARDPRYNLLNLESALRLGLIAYIPIVIHEFGHAITAKQVGCEVYKGGAMLYYGMPSAFVDTTDVWMFDKRARLAVTWGGPYTGYILGGFCAMIVYFSPGLSHSASVFLLQVALAGIFTTTFNLLPLLKLDGYYLLSDALEIPRLRERSMEFITHQLRGKLNRREKWTRLEVIFFGYGILAFLSTFIFTYWGVTFWDRQTSKSLSQLITPGIQLGRALASIGVILLVGSAIFYLIFLAAGGLPQIIKTLRRNGYLSTRWRAAGIISFSALMLATLPRLLLPSLKVWFTPISGVLAFALAASLAISLFIEMRGSVHAWMWLVAALGLLLGMGGFLREFSMTWRDLANFLEILGIACLLASFIFAGRLLLGLRGSWREISLLLLASGCAAWIASLSLPSTERTFAGFLLLGALLHWRMRPAPQIKMDQGTLVDSTRGKMNFAFNQIKTAILTELELDFGRKSRVWVEAGTYRPRQKSVGTAEFNHTIAGMTPDDYGGAMALDLEEVLFSVERLGGRIFVRRSLALGYDRLHWELHEIAEEYILKYITQASGLSKALTDKHAELDSFLRTVPLFSNLSSEEMDALDWRFTSRYFKRGEAIVVEGDVGDSFHLIRAGRAEVVSASGNRLNTLGRGDYFGEASLLFNARRNASILALTPLETFELSKTDFDWLIRANVKFTETTYQEFQRLRLLRQVPLFEQFTGSELDALARKFERVEYANGVRIIQQGESGDLFYLLESGKVSVSIDGQERAVLGTGEYFGEIALVVDIPRTATVTTLQPTILLQLSAVDFSELILASSTSRQALERVSSRRRLSNARWLSESVPASA